MHNAMFGNWTVRRCRWIALQIPCRNGTSAPSIGPTTRTENSRQSAFEMQPTILRGLAACANPGLNRQSASYTRLTDFRNWRQSPVPCTFKLHKTQNMHSRYAQIITQARSQIIFSQILILSVMIEYPATNLIIITIHSMLCLVNSSKHSPRSPSAIYSHAPP